MINKTGKRWRTLFRAIATMLWVFISWMAKFGLERLLDMQQNIVSVLFMTVTMLVLLLGFGVIDDWVTDEFVGRWPF